MKGNGDLSDTFRDVTDGGLRQPLVIHRLRTTDLVEGCGHAGPALVF